MVSDEVGRSVPIGDCVEATTGTNVFIVDAMTEGLAEGIDVGDCARFFN